MLNRHQFHVYLPWVNACLAQCLNSVLNVKVLVGAFNQEIDCEIFANLRIAFVSSSSAYTPQVEQQRNASHH